MQHGSYKDATSFLQNFHVVSSLPRNFIARFIYLFIFPQLLEILYRFFFFFFIPWAVFLVAVYKCIVRIIMLQWFRIRFFDACLQYPKLKLIGRQLST
jgi:hypothetical protein